MKFIIMGIILYAIYAALTPSSGERFDTGYSDGYASGYNTTCKIRVTMIEGDWSNKYYKKGYNEGYAAGSTDCRAR
jgi:hypothetical protein